MSDACAPFTECGDLDSRVLFQRSVYGPTLMSDTESLPFGALALRGAALRPYIDLHFEQRWVPRDLCLGPVSSVMTLAPGETVTVATRTEHRTSFTSLVRDATDRSSVSTHTRQGPDAPADFFPTTAMLGVGEAIHGQRDQQKMQSWADTVELRPMYAKGYGSWLSDIGEGALAVATGGASLVVPAVVGGVNDLVKNAVGSSGQPGAAVGATVAAITEVTDSISRSESQAHLSEATHSTEDTTSTSVTRTFSNPYRDRTMQLRFMPVFRRFDLVVSISRARVGLAMACGHLDFGTGGVGSRYAHMLGTMIAEPNLLRLAQEEIGVTAPDFHPGRGTLEDHLQANAAVYTKRFLGATVQARDEETLHGAFNELLNRSTSSAREAGDGDISAGLAWSESEVRSNVIHVPLSDTDSIRSAWRLDAETHAALSETISQLRPPELGALLDPLPSQTLHLYAGSHIEAVPGDCILPKIVTDALSVPDDDKE